MKVIDDPMAPQSNGTLMPLSFNPDVADLAPYDPSLTTYEDHAITYCRMLDADAEGADWREVSRIILHIDPVREPDRARSAFDTHLSRAKWVRRLDTSNCLGEGGRRGLSDP